MAHVWWGGTGCLLGPGGADRAIFLIFRTEKGTGRFPLAFETREARRVGLHFKNSDRILTALQPIRQIACPYVETRASRRDTTNKLRHSFAKGSWRRCVNA